MATGEVTQLLRAYDAGDSAFDRLIPIVYDELRRLARRQLYRGPRGGQTLDTAGLVHEAYLKLAGSSGLRLRDRSHLMAVTACAMGQVMVSRARAWLRDALSSAGRGLPRPEA